MDLSIGRIKDIGQRLVSEPLRKAVKTKVQSDINLTGQFTAQILKTTANTLSGTANALQKGAGIIVSEQSRIEKVKEAVDLTGNTAIIFGIEALRALGVGGVNAIRLGERASSDFEILKKAWNEGGQPSQVEIPEHLQVGKQFQFGNKEFTISSARVLSEGQKPEPIEATGTNLRGLIVKDNAGKLIEVSIEGQRGIAKELINLLPDIIQSRRNAGLIQEGETVEVLFPGATVPNKLLTEEQKTTGKSYFALGGPRAERLKEEYATTEGKARLKALGIIETPVGLALPIDDILSAKALNDGAKYGDKFVIIGTGTGVALEHPEGGHQLFTPKGLQEMKKILSDGDLGNALREAISSLGEKVEIEALTAAGSKGGWVQTDGKPVYKGSSSLTLILRLALTDPKPSIQTNNLLEQTKKTLDTLSMEDLAKQVREGNEFAKELLTNLAKISGYGLGTAKVYNTDMNSSWRQTWGADLTKKQIQKTRGKSVEVEVVNTGLGSSVREFPDILSSMQTGFKASLVKAGMAQELVEQSSLISRT